MSKELIEQLAKEHGGQRFRLHGDIGYSYQFTEPDLEAFAKAYQSASDAKVVAESEQQEAVAIDNEVKVTRDEWLAYNEWCALSKLTRPACPISEVQIAKINQLNAVRTSPPKQAILEGYALININELNKIVGEMQGNDCFSEEVLSAVLDYIDMKTAPTNTEVGQ